MRSSDDGTISSFRNAFSLPFLKRFGERDEPVTAGEADAAGPWRVEEIPGQGFALFRAGESPERGFLPTALFHTRSVALLAAAVLPGTGRDLAFRLDPDATETGFAVRTGAETAGHLRLFDERLIDALHVAEHLVRSPDALATLLEAAGEVALKRAGAILDSRV